MEMDESYFSYKRKSCDSHTDTTRAYRLNVRDFH